MVSQGKHSSTPPSRASKKIPDISVILVSWNTRDMTIQCMDSIKKVFKTSGLTHELILVDNGSTDDTVTIVKSRYPDTQIISNPVNIGFATAFNQGIFTSIGSKILALNTDIILLEKGFSELVLFLNKNPSCGIVAPALYTDNSCTSIELSFFPRYPNGWDYIWDILFGFRLNKWFTKTRIVYNDDHRQVLNDNDLGSKEPFKVPALSGAFLLIRKEVFDTVGYFDENFFFYFEDVDFCKRAAERGWLIYYAPIYRVIHLHNRSVKLRKDQKELYFASFYYYMEKYRRNIPLRIIKLLRIILK